MRKYLPILIFILIAFVSCNPDVADADSTNAQPDFQITESSINNIYIMDGLDYFTKLYWKITIYEDITDSEVTYRDVITSDKYRNMTLYTKSSYWSNPKVRPLFKLGSAQ